MRDRDRWTITKQSWGIVRIKVMDTADSETRGGLSKEKQNIASVACPCVCACVLPPVFGPEKSHTDGRKSCLLQQLPLSRCFYLLRSVTSMSAFYQAQFICSRYSKLMHPILIS